MKPSAIRQGHRVKHNIAKIGRFSNGWLNFPISAVCFPMGADRNEGAVSTKLNS